MPHLKCVPCRIRLRSADAEAGPADQACPVCGDALQPVARLAELVGFRSVGVESQPTGSGAWQDDAARLLGAVDNWGAAPAQARLDAERWLDESGSFRPEIVAAQKPPEDWR